MGPNPSWQPGTERAASSHQGFFVHHKQPAARAKLLEGPGALVVPEGVCLPCADGKGHPGGRVHAHHAREEGLLLGGAMLGHGQLVQPDVAGPVAVDGVHQRLPLE
eukprot:scaffold368446_cov41-Prasinocladus_malaysianus.AAC.1